MIMDGAGRASSVDPVVGFDNRNGFYRPVFGSKTQQPANGEHNSGSNGIPIWNQEQQEMNNQRLLTMLASLIHQNSAIMQNLSANNRPETFHYNVLPDLTNNIEDFTGLEGPADARAWLSQLESSAMLHCWTEAVAFETTRSHLKRAARNWYLAHCETMRDWKSF